MDIKKIIKNFFSKKDQEYVLSHPVLLQDIQEQKLDEEEIQTLLSTAYFVDAQKQKKQITMKLPSFTLENIKIRAKKEGMPYQTLINSILHKYISEKI